MRVVFASGIDDFCHRYGPLHWAEQLATQGIASTVRAHVDPRLAFDLATHDVLVLYRVPWSAWIAHVLEEARALGRATVFAVDDLIVDPALEDVPALRGTDTADRALWLDGVRRYRRTLEACDAFLTTTEALAGVGRAMGKPTCVHRAGLAARELALGDAAAARALEIDAVVSRPFRLGYLSGTPTHADDLRTITPALIAFLRRHPTAELLLGGHVSADAAFDQLGDRVRRAPYVPWTALPASIASVNVVLAPLEWRHPFVAAKGAIKYLEAAAVGVPVIASPSEAYRHAVGGGATVTGMLADGDDAWRAALDACVADPSRTTRLGRAARQDVEERFAPARQGAALAAWLETVAGASTRGAAGSTRASTPAHDDGVSERALIARFPGEVARAARESPDWPLVTTTATAISEPLGDDVVLAQCFEARGAITRVDVWTVTYGQPLDHALDVSVVDDEDRVLVTRRMPAALAPNAGWLAIDVAAPAPARATVKAPSRSFVVQLRAHGTGAGNALSFGTTAVTDTPPCTRNGTSGNAALALRVFGDDPSAAIHSGDDDVALAAPRRTAMPPGHTTLA